MGPEDSPFLLGFLVSFQPNHVLNFSEFEPVRKMDTKKGSSKHVLQLGGSCNQIALSMVQLWIVKTLSSRLYVAPDAENSL